MPSSIIDEDAGYQLKFLQGKDINITPNPEKSVYWVKFYNNSGADMNFYALTPELTGGKFFDVNNNSSGNSLLIPIGDGGNQQFGVVLSGVTAALQQPMQLHLRSQMRPLTIILKKMRQVKLQVM